jgi:hypothetical protein
MHLLSGWTRGLPLRIQNFIAPIRFVNLLIGSTFFVEKMPILVGFPLKMTGKENRT